MIKLMDYLRYGLEATPRATWIDMCLGRLDLAGWPTDDSAAPEEDG